MSVKKSLNLTVLEPKMGSGAVHHCARIIEEFVLERNKGLKKEQNENLNTFVIKHSFLPCR
jgi:hypothetical protein